MELNRKEALRYLGLYGKAADAEAEQLLDEVGAQFLDVIAPKCVYQRYPITVTETAVLLDGCTIESVKLAKHLRGCTHAYLFAATLGIAADNLIRRLSAADMARAAVGQAVCTALIESYCDEMQATIAAEEAKRGLYLKSRFSPGYGDLPLDCQKELFARLDCPKRIGVTLTDTLLMVPTKSVSAIIGLTDKAADSDAKCKSCDQRSCTFRTADA